CTGLSGGHAPSFPAEIVNQSANESADVETAAMPAAVIPSAIVAAAIIAAVIIAPIRRGIEISLRKSTVVFLDGGLPTTLGVLRFDLLQKPAGGTAIRVVLVHFRHRRLSSLAIVHVVGRSWTFGFVRRRVGGVLRIDDRRQIIDDHLAE